MNPREHQLFKKYPLNGGATLSLGAAPTPYHIYDGYGAFVGGVANLAAVQGLLRNDQVLPVQTTDGRALMGVWICNFLDASLGPHHELQFSIFVSQTKIDDLPSHPLNLLKIMTTRSDIQMMCHGLWNSTPLSVAYNRELLSLDARLSASTIECDKQNFQFRVTNSADGSLVCSGQLNKPGQASLRANLSLLWHIGLAQARRINQQPWLGLQIANPVTPLVPNNRTAQTFAKNDADRLRYFEPRTDSIALVDEPYKSLQFEPQFVQHMQGFKFVYLKPE
jgi:hypothetical protein